jgi:hypothetical protein
MDLQGGQATYGVTQCESGLGVFRVFTMATNDPNMFQLVVIPDSVGSPGDIVQIVLGNPSPNYQVVDPEVVLQPGQEIDAAYLSYGQLTNFTSVSIAPFSGNGQTFGEQTPPEGSTVTCSLPTPWDGSAGYSGLAN